MVQTKHLYYFFISLMAFIFSCQSSSTNSNTETKTTTTAEGSAIEKETNDNPSIAVFKTFQDFEPVLRREDDMVHVVNFWATWCKPCVAELPYFEKIHEKYKDKNVQVTLVSMDDAKKLDKKVRPFVEKKQLKSELVLLDDSDYNAWIDKVSPKWTGAIPATYIYTKDKSSFYQQEFTYEELEKTVKSFIN